MTKQKRDELWQLQSNVIIVKWPINKLILSLLRAKILTHTQPNVSLEWPNLELGSIIVSDSKKVQLKKRWDPDACLRLEGLQPFPTSTRGTSFN